MPQQLQEAIRRIAGMERCFDALQVAEASGRIDARQLQQLLDYYEGGQWLQDYQLDEQGLLPAELKRGVLSQDGVYDLLARLAGSAAKDETGGKAMKYLIVVDMQVDFITGSLGSAMAEAIVPRVVEKVRDFDGRVIFTRDTHFADYFSTQEGRKLPVEHCIKDSDGWQICPQLLPYVETAVDKITFGSVELPQLLQECGGDIDSIELCGLCTDICVISNAMLLKAAFPEVPIAVDAACCAGVTEESHRTALEAMKAVQIEIRDSGAAR